MSRVLKNATDQITRKYNFVTHKGIDLVKYKSKIADVLAHSDGEVVLVQSGRVNDRKSKGIDSYGNYVKLKHKGGYYTLYAHLKGTYVKKGSFIKRGTVLGLMGNSGNASGRHLHFEVRDKKDKRVDPTFFLENDLPDEDINKEISYQVYDNRKRKWLPLVKKEKDYAGNFKNGIGGLLIYIEGNDIKYRVHEQNRKWLPFVYGDSDYAGNKGKDIDGIQISSKNLKIAYRAHLINKSWLPWIYPWKDSKNAYAGVLGTKIDAVQIKIINE